MIPNHRIVWLTRPGEGCLDLIHQSQTFWLTGAGEGCLDLNHQSQTCLTYQAWRGQPRSYPPITDLFDLPRLERADSILIANHRLVWLTGAGEGRLDLFYPRPTEVLSLAEERHLLLLPLVVGTSLDNVYRERDWVEGLELNVDGGILQGGGGRLAGRFRGTDLR